MKKVSAFASVAVFVGFAFVPFVAFVSWAAEPSAEPTFHRGACKPDIEKFCKGEKKLEQIVGCLKAHQSELSVACKENGEALKEKLEEAQEKCQGDIQKFCKGVKPGAGRIANCLKSHQAELSAACKSVGKK